MFVCLFTTLFLDPPQIGAHMNALDNLYDNLSLMRFFIIDNTTFLVTLILSGVTVAMFHWM